MTAYDLINCFPPRSSRYLSELKENCSRGSASQIPRHVQRIRAPGIRIQAPGKRIRAPGIRIRAPGIRIRAPGIYNELQTVFDSFFPAIQSIIQKVSISRTFKCLK